MPPRHRTLSRYRPDNAAVNYVRWLMERHPGWTPTQAKAYAEAGGGAAGLAAIGKADAATAPPPRSQKDHAAAREADKPEADRRWERIWRGCPVRGCILSAGHEGAHNYPSGLSEREKLAAELAASEAELIARTGG